MDSRSKMLKTILDVWNKGKHEMESMIIIGETAGLSQALLRILAADSSICEAVLDGKRQFILNTERDKYIRKLAKILGYAGPKKKPNLGDIFVLLGTSRSEVYKWSCVEVDKRSNGIR